MNQSEVNELADHPDVPKLQFGSRELDEFHAKHCVSGRCTSDSGYYVVVHRSLKRRQDPPFRVLSYWHAGQAVPRAWDVTTNS